MTDGALRPILGDGKRLADILALAGPDMAPLILRQMQLDLTGVASALSVSLVGAAAGSPTSNATPDWPTIRAQTHVLISLAGTIGADRLHAAAIDLNAAAHDRDPARAATLAGPLLSDLGEVRAAIAARLPAEAPPPDGVPGIATLASPP